MELNILSEFMFELTVLITAILHIILPKSLEPAAAAFMIGNLFAIYVFPFSCLYAVFWFFDIVRFLPGVLLVYVVRILLDSSHLFPPDHDNYNHFRELNWYQRQSVHFWSAHFDYFPMTVKFDVGAKEAIDPKKQYIFGIHPHGIHCWPLNIFAFTSSVLFESFPKMQLVGVAATVMFKLPIVRELFMKMHYRDAGRKTCERILKAKSASGTKSSLYICTGGEAESLNSETGKDKVVLKGRQGFVRLALSWGCDLVPVYGMGVTDLYTTYSYGFGFRKWLAKTLHIAIPLFSGRFGTPLPHQRPVTVLIGNPIKVPKPKTLGEKPSDELVNEYHEKYIAALQKMYNDHCETVYGEKRELEVIKG